MVAVGISEFTFGYAFLYEQTHANWGDVQAAPILPSLQQEQHEGWDAHLPLEGTDFYYQFKLTDYLSRGNATFIADGTYNGPYYRLAFHRRNNNQQHQRLRDHSLTNPHTYYVAPEFNNADDFHAAFLAQQLTQRSRIIAVNQCQDANDGDQHFITFQPNAAGWIQHSPQERGESSISGKELPNLYRGTRREWKPIDKAFTEELFVKTADVVKRVLHREENLVGEVALPLLDFNPNQAERTQVLLRTSQVLSVFFGVTLVIIGAPQ